MIISNKHGIYELPHELPNDLRVSKLGKIRKISKRHRIITYCPVFPLNWIFLIIAENCWKIEIKIFHIALFHMKRRVCLIYPFHDYTKSISTNGKKNWFPLARKFVSTTLNEVITSNIRSYKTYKTVTGWNVSKIDRKMVPTQIK